MKQTFHLLLFIAIIIVSFSCGGSDSKKTSDNSDTQTTTDTKEKKTEQNGLITDAKAPPDISFASQDFEGMGTMQLPSGDDWQQESKSHYNEKLDMTVKIFVQNEGMLDVREEYVQSYIDNNHRDAPNFKLNNREAGTINDLAANRVTGSFNNGTEYTTRDYLFFTNDKTGILQVRIAKVNESKLKQVADFMAASFKNK